jgi:ribosome maturation factor RimP
MSTLAEKAKTYLEEALTENPQLFLVSFEVNQANHIKIVIDGDEDVSITDCMAVSRKVEHQLDRDEEDFAVEVTSFGVGEGLLYPRQYIKNVGRKLEVETQDAKIKADLVAANQDGIQLKWSAREPKPVGKGKHTVQKEMEIPYTEIKKAKVMIIFNK